MKIRIKILSAYNDNLKNVLIEIIKVTTDENGSIIENVVTTIGTTIAGDFEVGKTYIADLQEQTQE